MISGAGLCWQHVGGVGSTTTTTTKACSMTCGIFSGATLFTNHDNDNAVAVPLITET